MEKISNAFKIVETKFFMEAFDNDLEAAINALIETYSEFDKEQVVEEVKRPMEHYF